jgi:hypothetical protein
MGSLAGPRKPAGEAKLNVCVISDGEAGAYCTVGLVKYGERRTTFVSVGLSDGWPVRDQ